MIELKIYNDEKMRKYNNFPSIKDPYILENTLLKILNELYESKNELLESSFCINNPHIANTYVTYYTVNNFNIWGLLPIDYIYNDIIKNIQCRNYKTNFIFTLESIFIEYNKNDFITESLEMYLPNEIIGPYITENYISSYNYMINNTNSIMIVYIPKENGMMVYIMSTGFDQSYIAKWYNSSNNYDDHNAIPINRYKSLCNIVNTIETSYNIRLSPIKFESSDTRINDTYEKCLKNINKESLVSLKKKSEFDTEIKYGNYDINYNITDIYDNAVPACLTKLKDGTLVSMYNQEYDYKSENSLRLLKKQSDLIKIKSQRESK